MTGTTDAGGPPALTPEQARAQLPVRPGVVIAMLAVSAFVMILQETIVSVALQHLSVDLGVTASTVQWLMSGFLLTMGVVIPTTGYLLQRLTPRQVFLISMSLFTVGTVVCAAAPGFAVLLTGRVIQAVGTALIIPLLMTTIMNIVPVQRRGSTMGTISIVIAVAPALGPTVGGLILESLSWRWMFLSVVPLSALMLLLGLRFMRLDSATRSTPLDVVSVVLSAVAFGGIVYGFSTLGEHGGGGVPAWIPLVAGFVALAIFVHRQLRLQRGDGALLDMRPFGNYQFRVSVILGALVFMALLGAGAVLLPIYLQTVLGLGADITGLAVLPGGIALALLGKPVGWMFDRVGPRPLMIPGAFGLTAALWGFALIDTQSLWPIIGVHMLLMASLAFMMTPLLAAALGSLPSHLYSHGSAILTTLQQVAGAASIAALVTLAGVASASADGTVDATGLRAAFMAAGVIGILAIIISFFLRGRVDGLAADAPRTTEPSTEAGSEAAPEPAAQAESIVEADASPVPAAVAAGGAPAAATVVPATGAPERAPVGALLRGRVHSVAGTPRAAVTLIDPNGTQRGRARTDDGEFRVEVPGPGTWYVVVSAPGHQPRADRVLVDERGSTLEHDVALSPHERPRATGEPLPSPRPGARTR